MIGRHIEKEGGGEGNDWTTPLRRKEVEKVMIGLHIEKEGGGEGNDWTTH